MTTAELTGRELDAEVAKLLGWRCDSFYPPCDMRDDRSRPVEMWYDPAGKWWPHLPTYSAPDCSGLAPVLAWLEANLPSNEEAGELAGLTRNVWPASLTFDYDAKTGWEAAYTISGEWTVHRPAPDLPTAAARLLVAWAGRKGAT